MNLIRCEACGASNLLKDGDYFVCAYCGCKYRKEDIMIGNDGQVNIANSNVVINSGSSAENILTIARRAHHDQNIELAKRNYNKLLTMDPSSWEAYFYTLYYDIMTCRTNLISDKCENMIGGMETALQMMFDNVIDSTQRKNNMRQIAVDFMYLADKLSDKILGEASAVSAYKSTEYIANYSAVAICMATYCSTMYNTFGNSQAQLYYDCWCKSVDMLSYAVKITVDKFGRWKTKDVIRSLRDTAAPHILKLKQYNPSYIKPKNL